MSKLKRKGMRLIAVLTVMTTLVGTGGMALQVLTAEPAQATTACALKYGSCCPQPAITYYHGDKLAKCYSPGDNGQWMAALYECDQPGLMNAFWTTPWHNVEACMDDYLARTDRDWRTIQAHILNMYMHHWTTTWFWNKVSDVITFMTAVTRTWVRQVLIYGPAVFCGGIAAGAGPKLATAFGIGCDWAVATWMEKYHILQD